jgi:hypothetical protein
MHYNFISEILVMKQLGTSWVTSGNRLATMRINVIGLTRFSPKIPWPVNTSRLIWYHFIQIALETGIFLPLQPYEMCQQAQSNMLLEVMKQLFIS